MCACNLVCKQLQLAWLNLCFSFPSCPNLHLARPILCGVAPNSSLIQSHYSVVFLIWHAVVGTILWHGIVELLVQPETSKVFFCHLNPLPSSILGASVPRREIYQLGPRSQVDILHNDEQICVLTKMVERDTCFRWWSWWNISPG